MDNTNDKYLRLPAVIEKVAMSRATIYRRIEDGLFPAQITLSPGCVGWLESEINAWMDKCKQNSRIQIEETKK